MGQIVTVPDGAGRSHSVQLGGGANVKAPQPMGGGFFRYTHRWPALRAAYPEISLGLFTRAEKG
jgi:hypothetical protein